MVGSGHGRTVLGRSPEGYLTARNTASPQCPAARPWPGLTFERRRIGFWCRRAQAGVIGPAPQVSHDQAYPPPRPDLSPAGLSDEFAADRVKQTQQRAFAAKGRIEAPP